MQLVNVIRDGNKKAEKADFDQNQQISEILELLKSMTGSSGVDKKIDNISTFLLRMNNKIDSISRYYCDDDDYYNNSNNNITKNINNYINNNDINN